MSVHFRSSWVSFNYIYCFKNTFSSVVSLEVGFVNERVIVLILQASKAVPLQAWSGPEGSRKLRFPDFVTNGTGLW